MIRSVLITGASGCLGRHLLAAAPADFALCAQHRSRPLPVLDRPLTALQLDLADADATRAALARLRPDCIIHAAYGQQDPERDTAQATRHLAAAAAAARVPRLVLVSSDMVFRGDHGPYDESRRPDATSAYGRAKIAAETAVQAADLDAVIARCSLIVGSDPVNPSSAWILDKLRAGEPVTLFTDEIRSPILASDLAAALWELARRPARECCATYHLAGPEALSRYTLGLLLAHHYGLDARLLRPASVAALAPDRPRDLRLATRMQAADLATPLRAIATGLGLHAPP